MVLFLTVVFLLLALGFAYLLRSMRALSRQVARLTARVYELERREGAGSPVSLTEETKQTVPVPPPLPVRRRDDWETVVGTNWLNRAGALVLVIGIALFLGYSLTHLGPVGKIAIGFAVGVSMLAAGLTLEKNERYRNFALSFIGGGWAAIYLTGYAAHAIEAARVVSSPVAGMSILLVISAGMILHALRYKSETATALAFLFAFASLNMTPLTGFSVVAIAVLAAALLFVASTFSWRRLAVAGTVLTYTTLVLRYDPSIGKGQATLWIYWLLFEVFDLINLWRRGSRNGVARSLFFLNACGFIGAALVYEWRTKPADWALFFAIASGAYLASAVIRARLIQGGYEAAVAAAAGLMAAALIDYYRGLRMPLALLIEGELVAIAGMALKNRTVQHIGAIVLLLAFGRLISVDVWSTESWTPLALLMAAAFAANRLAGQAPALYGAAASILIALVANTEANRYWATAIWALLTAVVLAVGVYKQQRDLRIQAYAGILITFIRALAVNLSAPDASSIYMPVATAAAIFFGCQALIPRGTYIGAEAHARSYVSLVATFLTTLLLFDAVQGRLLTVALGFEAATLLVAGFAAAERVLRLSGLIIFLLCIGKLFVYDLRELDMLSRILSFVVLGVMLLAASWVYTRFREKIKKLL